MSLTVKNLNYSVHKKQLLKDINSAIDSAKLVGIIGPNGAGKSTLLNCISGLISTQANIELNNKPLESYSDSSLAKVRAALPQSSGLTFPFKAKDIVAMSFALSAISTDQQKQYINQSLDVLSATGLADRNYLNLSGGEKQRVQLARVFAQLLPQKDSDQMRFLLLDEPTAPLDLKFQFKLFAHLKKLIAKNITTIAVVHDINLAATYCDEIWVMQAGEMINQDRPRQVISSAMMKEVFDVDVDIQYHQNQLRPIISNPI